MKLYNPTDAGRSMYYSLARESEQFEIVDTVDFHTLFSDAEVDKIDFMKIDIEGAEEDLILSETGVFEKKQIKVIYVDSHSGVDYGAIANHLKKFGYTYREFHGGHLFT